MSPEMGVVTQLGGNESVGNGDEMMGWRWGLDHVEPCR